MIQRDFLTAPGAHPNSNWLLGLGPYNAPMFHGVELNISHIKIESL